MLITSGAKAYDRLRVFWINPKHSKRLSCILVLFFAVSWFFITLNKSGLLPDSVGRYISKNPFDAINLAFALVLGIEVIELIFAVADSVSRAVGKQIEIMALILLRDVFKDISHLHWPKQLTDDTSVLMQIVVLAVASLVMFICLGFYVKLQRLRVPMLNQKDKERYIASKKCISLFLFVVFAGLGLNDLYGLIVLGAPGAFFLHFYGVLIFSDILLVLVGQCYMPSFHATFRNSGYAAGTLLMRIALAAPHEYCAGLSVFAAVFVLGLTWATGRFLSAEELGTR